MVFFCIFKMGIARENEGNIESKGQLCYYLMMVLCI